ncbi:MAG: xanthine dehydrogenase family protein molybdopterin-binding subunit [Acetobacterales bacterium]
MGEFGISQPVRRKEDLRLITGGSPYTDDIAVEGQAFAAFLRSPMAHAKVTGLDTSMAKDMPGVIAVYTIADVRADGLADLQTQAALKDRQGNDLRAPARPLLADGEVRFVGDPIAMVVAETQWQARDAAEAVIADFEELPAIVDARKAIADGAPVLWEGWPDNVCFDWDSGDEVGTGAAFAKAATVVRIDLVNNRVYGSPMEPRVCFARYEPDRDRVTLTCPSQGAHKIRNNLCDGVFGWSHDKLHVISPATGGGFGIRSKMIPELALIVWAAKKTGRPVRWRGDRSESFVTDSHGRDNISHAELALDADGRILGMRIDTLANIGAYASDNGPRVPTGGGGRVAGTVYDIPALYQRVRCVFSSTSPTDSYRGAGRPEACYLMERLADKAAMEIGMAPDEFRRLNFIRKEALPYQSKAGSLINSGDFTATMDIALERADWAGFPARRKESEARGKLRGIGIGYFMEASGGPPQEEARVRFEPDGKVKILAGTHSYGQGHETTFAQIVTDTLGVPFDDISLVQGDTDLVPYGNGSGGSRSSQMGGVAVLRASKQIVEKGKKIAGHLMQREADAVVFREGNFVAGEASVSIAEVAKAALERDRLPDGMEPGLDETCRYKREAAWTFPNGCHVCEVEIDPDTGRTTVLRYTACDDCGRILNPLIVHGQIHGGVAQGIGQAMLEEVRYDAETAQLVTGSFMDYCMPRADDLSDFDAGFNEVLDPDIDLGVKGAGEGGTSGAPPAFVNAVIDALKDRGVTQIDMPVTPNKVWAALRAATAPRAAE